MPKSPATPAKPASIRAAEKIEQDVKKATGAEITNHMNNLDSSPDVKVVAEQSLSKALMKKLLDGSKLTSAEQKQVALVCKQVGFL